MRLVWCILLFAGMLSADEPKQLSFHLLTGLDDRLSQQVAVQELQKDLAPYHQHQVIIKGFLYSSSNHQWILASEPNLKSCCVASSEKISQQLMLADNFAGTSSNRAINVSGIFMIDPIWNQQGQLIQLYRLSDASIVKNDSWSLSKVAFAAIGLFGLAALIALAYKKRPVNGPP